MKYLLYVFYLEIVINIVSEVQCFFAPATFIAQFSDRPVPAVTLDLVRWYGVLLFVLTYLLYRALRIRGTMLIIVLQGFLIGDVIQIIVVLATTSAARPCPLAVSAPL